MERFKQWLITNEEFSTSIGPSGDWSDPKGSEEDRNGLDYKARGVRSKWVCNMKSEKRKLPRKPK